MHAPCRQPLIFLLPRLGAGKLRASFMSINKGCDAPSNSSKKITSAIRVRTKRHLVAQWSNAVRAATSSLKASSLPGATLLSGWSRTDSRRNALLMSSLQHTSRCRIYHQASGHTKQLKSLLQLRREARRETC